MKIEQEIDKRRRRVVELNLKATEDKLQATEGAALAQMKETFTIGAQKVNASKLKPGKQMR